jgi:hypothetical protein
VNIATRKITSLTFLLLGFAPLLFVVLISLKKHEIRARMEEEMETRDLQSITIPEAEVVWMDKHEIWIHNQMFDIHTRELVNGIYHFTGLYDAEETALVEEEKSNGQRQQSKQQLLVKLFKSIPSFHDSSQELFLVEPAYAENILPRPAAPATPFCEILTPPPRQVSLLSC